MRVVNDLVEFGSWKNSSRDFWIEDKVIFDLLKGISSDMPSSSLSALLREKKD